MGLVTLSTAILLLSLSAVEASGKVYHPGHRVKFHGLNNGKVYNGTKGTILYRKSSERWAVLSDFDGKLHSFKATNIAPASAELPRTARTVPVLALPSSQRTRSSRPHTMTRRSSQRARAMTKAPLALCP